MPNTDKTILLPQLQRYDQKIKGWANNKFLTKADTPSLPKATATTLGGVKVGNGLSITDDGVLSAEDDIVFTRDFDTSAFSCNKTFAEVKKITTTGVRRTATVNGLLENTSITLLVEMANDDGVMFFGTAPKNTFAAGMLGSRTHETITYLFQRGLVIAYMPDGQIYMTEDLSSLGTNMSFDFKNTTFQYDQYSSFDLKDGGVASAKIANSAITAAKLASNAVTADKIADGAITANKIADGVIDAATDVRMAGKSITADGVADIPIAKDNDLDSSNNNYGVVKSRGSAYGIFFHPNGVCTSTADSNEINSRKNNFKPIAPAMLDYAVKAAMCDGKGAAWTDAEKLAARERLGIGKYELIEEIIVGENTSAIVREATPSKKPYSFGRLIIDFDENGVSSSTQTQIYLFINDINISESVAVFSGNGNSKARIFVDTSCGIIDAQWARGSFYNTAVSSMERLMQSKEVLLSEKISSIKLQCQESSTFKAGTVVTIYGVWA